MSLDWSSDTSHYELADGYCLQRAELAEYGAFAAVYLPDYAPSEPSWESHVQTCSNWSASPFWIQKGDRRIGGVSIEPNAIGGLFLIPPFSDSYAVLRALVASLLRWSDDKKDIRAWPVFPSQREQFQRLGFALHHTSRSMARPTETFAVEWESRFQVAAPQEGQAEDIARLLCEAFLTRGVQFNYDNQVRMMRRCIEMFAEAEAMRDASTLVTDVRNNQLVGACIISLKDPWPMVFDVAVRPDHQRQGLATGMLKKALTVLKKAGYPVLTLYLTVGNRAESVYYNLGFQPGVEIATLHIPARQAT